MLFIIWLLDFYLFLPVLIVFFLSFQSNKFQEFIDYIKVCSSCVLFISKHMLINCVQSFNVAYRDFPCKFTFVLLQSQKVVLLEDLASRFKLKTQVSKLLFIYLKFQWKISRIINKLQRPNSQRKKYASPAANFVLSLNIIFHNWRGVPISLNLKNFKHGFHYIVRL